MVNWNMKVTLLNQKKLIKPCGGAGNEAASYQPFDYAQGEPDY